MATISFFTAFTEPLLEKRRVRPFEVLLGLLVVAGIALVAGFERGRTVRSGRRAVRAPCWRRSSRSSTAASSPAAAIR